jgi:DNA-binding response OmpR family regulator
MNNPSVLVVDDEKSLRDFVRKNLEIRGYRVLTASNGLEALAIFNTERIDLVILDIIMPDVSGLTVLEIMKEIAPCDESD